ncbi:unnamed protein product, partial [Mesorhabditis belari]|uniref:Protein YIPF n=1 Tax=Mesorhabditis belari TaxID=2138241 RepID=A0AAF3ED04_9BILA
MDPPVEFNIGTPNHLPQQQSPGQTAIDFSQVTGIDTLGFYDSSAYMVASHSEEQNQHYDYSGNLSTTPSTSKSYTKVGAGPASKFLDSRGFGWLLEVDEEDENQKPLLEELDVDLTDIYYKIRCVLLPLPYFRLKLSIVRESPDFWGPLLVVIAYSVLSIYGQLSVVSWILTIWFCGAFLVFFLARALGGEVGYSQVLGIIGYCLIPLVVTGLLMSLFKSFRFVSFLFGTFGIGWSVYSAGALLCIEELTEKRTLLLYPVFLLYIYFFSLYHGV